ncbi:MAG: LacI family transcriptional regulator [Cellulomonadaceae bacterium]|nr:LacI family transcriptional regulator [Cellulomonadaceae bacterium]
MPEQTPSQRGRGRERASLKDVAKLAGVSPGTVSNVFHHPERVAPETARRIRAAIEDLQFAPNRMASALARGDTRTIGLVVIDLGNSLFIDIARGAQRSARQQNFYLQLATSDDDRELLDAHMRVMDTARVTGMIIAPLDEHHQSIDSSRREGVPVVVANYDSAAHDTCQVLVDNELAGYLAIQHLIGLGRDRLAFVGGRNELQPVARRRTGARRAVAEAHGEISLTEMSTITLNAPSGAAIGRELAALPPDERPNGVLAATDLLAMAIINELTAAGISVPGQIAVMGCDHNSAAWGGAMSVSSISMEGEKMGEEAVRLLLEELNDDPTDHVHRTVMLTPSLVARESTVGRPG